MSNRRRVKHFKLNPFFRVFPRYTGCYPNMKYCIFWLRDRSLEMCWGGYQIHIFAREKNLYPPPKLRGKKPIPPPKSTGKNPIPPP